MTSLALRTAFLVALSPAAALAQPPRGAGIPVRHLTPAISTDSGVVANTYAIRVLSDGRVLHNDAIKHRLVLFDATLRHYTVLADTAGESTHGFGMGLGGLLPYPGDSTVWVDAGAQALVVVDASGKFGRVMASPKPAEMRFYSGSLYGAPGFDMNGHLYYRGVTLSGLPAADYSLPPMPDSSALLPDSVPIIRVDFDARRLDTVADVHVPTQRVHILRGDLRGYSTVLNPLQATDEWAYLPDGTIAIVRAHDYHVDWIKPDGTRESSPKMPFDWRRVSDAERQRLVDSTRRYTDSIYAIVRARLDTINLQRKMQGLDPSHGVAHMSVVEPAELPDYYPAIRPNSQIRVDRDGNLWVMPATSLGARGGMLVDVINRKGEIVERVQLPEGRNLHGFGPDGTIYLSVPVEYGWPRLERATIIR